MVALCIEVSWRSAEALAGHPGAWLRLWSSGDVATKRRGRTRAQLACPLGITVDDSSTLWAYGPVGLSTSGLWPIACSAPK